MATKPIKIKVKVKKPSNKSKIKKAVTVSIITNETLDCGEF